VRRASPGRLHERGGTTISAGAEDRDRWAVPVGFYLFVLFGVVLGAVGVLLPAQMRTYHVDQATIGTTFVANAGGFVLASVLAGPLGHRHGVRRVLAGTSLTLVVSFLTMAAGPPLAVLVLANGVAGAASGLAEGILNVHVTSLPSASRQLNRLHGFFGVGALLGPLLAAGLLTVTGWQAVPLALTALALPAAAVGWLAFPHRDRDPLVHPPEPVAMAADAAEEGTPTRPPGGRAALRAVALEPAALWAGALLAIYVGLEASVGNWGYTYLVAARGVGGLLAGYTSSGYWFGLTAGRFLSTPATVRLRSPDRLLTVSIAGAGVACAVLWAAPSTAGLASLSFVLLGFFLGPVFPTTMLVSPRLITARLVPTMIGALGAVGVAGGALFPWIGGTVIQLAGAWTLPPYALVLGVVQFALWRRLARFLAQPPVEPALGEPALLAAGGPTGD
jgi:fucose permease